MKIIRTANYSKISKDKAEDFKVNAGIDDVKDVRGRTRDYRVNTTPVSEIDRRLSEELSGESDQDRDEEMADKWRDLLRKHRDRDRIEEPAYASVSKVVIEAKKRK